LVSRHLAWIPSSCAQSAKKQDRLTAIQDSHFARECSTNSHAFAIQFRGGTHPEACMKSIDRLVDLCSLAGDMTYRPSTAEPDCGVFACDEELFLGSDMDGESDDVPESCDEQVHLRGLSLSDIFFIET